MWRSGGEPVKASAACCFMAIIMFLGCGIEEKIDTAANKCEDKISKVLEGIENVCLTKEEILELISSIKEFEDVNDITTCEEDTMP